MADKSTDEGPACRIAEYNSLAVKMDHAVRDQHIAEVVFASAIALFYAWATSEGKVSVARVPILWAVPTILACLGLLRIWHRGAYISLLESYTRDLERALFGPNGGWECRYEDKGRQERYPAARLITWSVAIISTLVVSIMLAAPPST